VQESFQPSAGRTEGKENPKKGREHVKREQNYWAQREIKKKKKRGRKRSKQLGKKLE